MCDDFCDDWDGLDDNIDDIESDYEEDAIEELDEELTANREDENQSNFSLLDTMKISTMLAGYAYDEKLQKHKTQMKKNKK